MPKAAHSLIRNVPPVEPIAPEVTPEKFEIIDGNKVKVSLRDQAGALVVVTMDFLVMIESINMATKLLNSNIGKFVDAAVASVSA